MTKVHVTGNTYTLQHQGDPVGVVYTHTARHNAHVLVFHSAMAQAWVQGNPWLLQQVAQEMRTEINPTGYFITITREEESTIKLELSSRLASTNKLSAGYLFDGEYLTDAMHEALQGEPRVVSAEVVEEVAKYLRSYLR